MKVSVRSSSVVLSLFEGTLDCFYVVLVAFDGKHKLGILSLSGLRSRQSSVGEGRLGSEALSTVSLDN